MAILRDHDPIKHPAGYCHGDIECWDAIQHMLSPEEWKGFVKGVVVQYVWREQYKGGKEDIKKAAAYLAKFLEGLGG